MPVTNSLDIDIKASAQKATPSLDTMIAKLKEVDAALDSLNPQKLREISDSIKGLKGAKVNIGGSGSISSTELKKTNDQYTRANSLLNTLTATTNKANKGFLNLNGTMFKLAATWGMFYASAYPVIRLMNKAWQSTESAMDYVETYNYYKVTMDKIFQQVGEDSADTFQESYINSLNSLSEKMTGFKVGMNGELFENYSKNLGADPNALMNYQARIGAVTNAVGLLAEESVNTQKALSMLSQDLSSLTNTPLESVMTNLQSGLIGQSRALYKYGIDITQATLKTYALEHGVTQAVSSMTQAQKMELRMLAILDQSKVAWGDMANTVNSVANQYRIFGQSVSNLSRVIGNLFLPIVRNVLPYVNALLISLRQMFTLLGFKLYGNNWLSDSLQGISNGYSGVEDVADALEDVEDSADGASKSAKKLKQNLMGFDELNIINDQTSSSGSGSGGGGNWDLSDDIEDALADYESVWNKAFADAENNAQKLANRIMSYVKRGDFYGLGEWISDNLASELNSIDWNRIYKGAEYFGTGLAQFLNGTIKPSTFAAVGKTVASSLNTAIYAALAFGKEFDFANLGDSIASYWNAIFDNFDFGAFGETIGIWLGGITKTIATAIRNIKWDNLFDGFKEGVNGFFKGLGESGVTIGDIAIVIGALTIKKILKFAWGAAALKLISQTLAKGLASRIGIDIAADATFGQAISQGLASSISGFFPKISQMFSNMKDYKLGEAVFGDYSSFGAAWTTTFGAMSTAILGFGSTIGGVALTVHEFFDMWENGFDGVSFGLETLGVAITGFGAVLLGLNPITAAVVGGIGLIGSAAVLLAHDQLPDVGEIIYNTLANPGGTPIGDITNNVAEKIRSVGDVFNTVSTEVKNNEDIKTSMQNISEDILGIQTSMEIGTTSVEDGVEQMKNHFASLEQATKSYFDNTALMIEKEFGPGGLFEGYLEKQGYTVDEVVQHTITLGDTVTQEMTDAWNKYLELSPEEQASEQGRNLLAIATGWTSDYEKIMSSFSSSVEAEIANIDWSILLNPDGSINEDAWSTELSKITTAISDTQAEVQTASDELMNYYSELKLKAEQEGDEQGAAYYQALINAIQQGSSDLMNEVAQEGQAYTDAVQKAYLEDMKEAISSSETDQVALDIANKMTNSLNILSSDIETKMSEIGIEGAGWGQEVSNQIVDSIFNYQEDAMTGAHMREGLKSDWQSIFDALIESSGPNSESLVSDLVDKIIEHSQSTIPNAQEPITESYQETMNGALENVEVETGLHSIVDRMVTETQKQSASLTTAFNTFGANTVTGFNTSFSNNMKSTYDLMKQYGQGIETSFHDSSLTFGSPSKKMGDYALWTIQGFNNTMLNNIKTSEPIMQQWGTLIVNSFEQCFTDAFTNVSDTWDELVPYFEHDIFNKLNSALEEELIVINDDVSNNYKDLLLMTNQNYDLFEQATTELTTNLTTTFDTTTTGISQMFTTMWTSIKQSSVINANAIAGVFEGLTNNLANGINSFLSSTESELKKVASKTGTSFSGFGRVSGVSISRLSVNAYRTGGFPEDGLFFANHNELVGQFSNGQTAVANNEQIVEGIRYGVQSAVNEALAPYLQEIANNTGATANNTEDIKNKPSQTFTDRDVARANLRGARSMGLTLRTT